MAIAVASSPSATATSSSGVAPPRSRVSCRREPRGTRSIGRARCSRSPAKGAEPGKERQTPQDDSSYLWKLGLGSVGGAAAIKYGSVLLPDITRPNIVQALLMVSLPVVAAVLILLKLSGSDTEE
ncbi:uncharacterized protein LOC100832056 [Brachypodium distachyon]|uniref:Uncharacterized protein n=1 Tax=Brachypodium distachyon TaxID=15368 RepID=I1IDM1_BRADI|nr:uncharacterized protein LOC100832056 [Brachypodium distachyon]KQK01218.1 hypothetical protein BRADI_3g54540v3 [Brachypodium distachyon]|eukprot:XP_003572912.1 uncharacterized protein LOC100832056 [Brachypodium distachyon]